MFVEEKEDHTQLTPILSMSSRYDFYNMLSISLDLRMTGVNDSGTNMLTSIDRECIVNLLDEASKAYLSCRDLSINDKSDFIFLYFSDLLLSMRKEIIKQNTIPVIQIIANTIYHNFSSMLTPIEKFAFVALACYPTRENWLATMDKLGIKK